MSKACDLIAEMLLILNKLFSTWVFEGNDLIVPLELKGAKLPLYKVAV